MTASKSQLQVDLKNVIGPAFYEVHRKIRRSEIDEAVEEGGRGSLKSSFCSIELVLFLLRHPKAHGLVTRQVADTLRDSVLAQIQWAIDMLGLNTKFHVTQSPMQCVYKPTGQRIYFRGLDDPIKIKSIKPPFGYIGCVWFEEADQVKGGESTVRNVQQSAFRAGDETLLLISYNPPANSKNWVNRYAREQRPGKNVHHSNYGEAPPEWLGKKFLEQAEWVRKTKPLKYRHEYLGEIVGSGTQVFDNIVAQRITAKTVAGFGEIVNGVDWGWYPDPWAFNRVYYDSARRTLYIFEEVRGNKLDNFVTAELVKKKIAPGELVTADSAELKSCADYRSRGIRCRAAEKPPGSVNQSMKWLQSLAAIIIDPVKCPATLTEFSEYEYETAHDGTVLSEYMDAHNHNIDAVRYATNRIWLRKGT